MKNKILDFLISGAIWGLTALVVLLGGISLYRSGYDDGYADCNRGITPDVVKSQSISLHTADSVSPVFSYNGSNFPILVSLFDSAGGFVPYRTDAVLTDYIPISFNFYPVYENNSSLYNISFTLLDETYTIDNQYVIDNNWMHDDLYIHYLPYSIDHVIRCSFGIGSDTGNFSNFNYDIRYFVVRYENSYYGNNNLGKTHINFYDSNGNDLSFTFGVSPGYDVSLQSKLINKPYVFHVWNNVPNYVMQSRTYYLSSSFSDNESYQVGYKYGESIGFSNGEQSGYNKGIKIGQSLGEQVGFDKGVQSANQYTFLALMGAILDAPVNTFTGLLNFEILGFNILSLLTAIMTISLIIFIVRFVFFRK